MKFLLSIVFILLTFLKCKPTSNVILQGEINVIVDSIFIADAYKWNRPVLFINVNDGKFNVSIPKDLLRSKRITEVSVGYLDKMGEIHLFEFINRELSRDSIKYLYSSFILDTTITLKSSGANTQYLEIFSGQETKAMYRTQMMNFGYLNADLSKRTEQLQLYTKIIESYNSSIFLLTKLNENKSTLKKTELTALLNRFDSKASKTNIFQALKKYAENKSDNPVFENYKFENQLGIATEIYSSKAKVNMIVFWASWCAPCRQEIPELKKLAEKYKRSELNIVSISIDDSRKSWLSAVAAEQMNWPQLIIPESKMQQLKEQFEIGAIPYTLFLESNGKLISRFIGNDENSVSQYEQIINANLK